MFEIRDPLSVTKQDRVNKSIVSLTNALIYVFVKALDLTLLHSERPKFFAVLAFLSAVGLISFLNKTKKKKK